MSTTSGVKGKQNESLLGLSLSEARIILLGMLCTDSSGKVDFEKLAVKGSYKNASSSGSSYHQARRKFFNINGDPQSQGGGTSTAAASPGTQKPKSRTPKQSPVKRKREAAAAAAAAAAAPADSDNANPDGVVPSTPKPKRQCKTSPKKKEVAPKGESDEADIESDAKIGGGGADPHLVNVRTGDDEPFLGERLDVEAEFMAMESTDEVPVKGEEGL
ncbi:hypothetical protein P175DRAFT_0489238 [Aspergillus ochraceoroseus IBT 24754]|uniref:Uncharacterized protein n=1 Tax=Aspergillus ochraceoroseus IBT 24754 TaxID=1392256 RepID=A0A2T5M6A7_9EURO|nr:uncharacterized protein P175DRAFT_0489238 [Aspergillus ochraceoroseus IBT 24754]PTU24073.1 hypothetical protein P175DRAFT_0489238 [Aspergillus ochraceoroseus IBT 24754]